MVETMVRRSSSRDATPACRAAIPTAMPIGPAPMTRRSVDSMSPIDLDDLVASGPHAPVPGRHSGERLEPVEIGPCLGGKIGESPCPAGGPAPAGQHLILGLDLSQELDFGGHLLAMVGAQGVGGADGDLVERVEDVQLGHR